MRCTTLSFPLICWITPARLQIYRLAPARRLGAQGHADRTCKTDSIGCLKDSDNRLSSESWIRDVQFHTAVTVDLGDSHVQALAIERYESILPSQLAPHHCRSESRDHYPACVAGNSSFERVDAMYLMLLRVAPNLHDTFGDRDFCSARFRANGKGCTHGSNVEAARMDDEWTFLVFGNAEHRFTAVELDLA